MTASEIDRMLEPVSGRLEFANGHAITRRQAGWVFTENGMEIHLARGGKKYMAYPSFEAAMAEARKVLASDCPR